MTPLMYAVKDNRTPILDRLIELGSDVGARNNVSQLRLLIFIIHAHISADMPTPAHYDVTPQS